MKLVILQLSDIHFTTDSTQLLERIPRIVSMAVNLAPTASGYIIAVTGDVAFSGQPDEYKLAASFFTTLKAQLLEYAPTVEHFFIPGNHDLDLTHPPDTRDTLLQHTRHNYDTLDPNGETVKQILTVQANFFAFEAEMSARAPRTGSEQMAYSHTYDVGGKRIRIRCLNTAWMSTNPEVPANLVYPPQLLKEQHETAEIEIAALHHPLGWLMPSNARQLRTILESSADIILTGHEHETAMFQKQSADGSSTQHLEGAVLQGGPQGTSEFNAVVIEWEDEQPNSFEAFICKWDGEKYFPTSLGARPFTRNLVARKELFRHTDSFATELNSPGLPILHPRTQKLGLDDIFVYPSLARKDPERKFQVLKIIDSPDVLAFIARCPRLVIFGDEISGKTSLAKRLCTDLLVQFYLVTVLLKACDIEGYKERDIKACLRKAVTAQYGPQMLDRYFDLLPEQRVIVVDDWHNLKFTGKAKAAILAELRSRCDHLILFTSHLYALEELADLGPARDTFADFEFCDISEFSKRWTGQLIQRWHSIGLQDAQNSADFWDNVKLSEDKVTAVMGKGLLPTFPIFILGMLQSDVSSTATSQSAGAYGHIIEMLITDRLLEVSKAPTFIGTMYTYMSRVAYFMFEKDRKLISAAELSFLHADYCSRYQLRLPETETIESLIKAHILSRDGDTYRFTYKGLYCYAVARYFFENIADNADVLRPQLDNITDRLAYEEYTNIVMLYLYLSRDSRTIERLLANAGRIYAECEPVTLDSDVDFVNSLMKGTLDKLRLPGTSIAENLDQYRGQQDSIQQSDPEYSTSPDVRATYEATTQELVKLTIGLQTLRVMGQVLRNFPGVLTAEPKLKLAKASYLLGLRILGRVFTLFRGHLQEIRSEFAEIFKERHPLLTNGEIVENADQTVIWLAGAAAYGIIKRICRSIGLRELEITFDEVGKSLGESTAVRLTHLAIALEYFKYAPKTDIYDIEDSIRKNPFCYRILRDLVSEYLYLRNTDRRLAQELGDRFDIEVSKPEFMLNKAVGVEPPKSKK